MATKQYDNYADLITFTRASSGTALRHVGYGAELVTNGTFDADISGWTLSAYTPPTWNAAGTIQFNSDGVTFSDADQSFSTTIGATYVLSLEQVNVAGTTELRVGTAQGGSQNLSAIVSTLGVQTFTFVATSTTTWLRLRDGAVSTNQQFDNVSVKEVIFDRATDPLILFNHPTNIPRIEYDADGNRLGLLIEEQRTNLLTYSAFDAGVPTNWSVGFGDGTFTHTLGTEIQGAPTITHVQSTLGRSYIRQLLTLSASTTYTFSIKIDTELSEITSGNEAVIFITGFSDISGNSRLLSDVGSDGLLSVTFTTATDVTGEIRIGIGTNGDATGTLVFSQPQLEAGSFPTSYIPTSGATATRSADVASIPVTDFGYNQKAGTVVVEAKSAVGTSNNVLLEDVEGFFLSDTDDTNLVGSNIYTSDFTSGVDGWTANGQATLAAVSSELEVTGNGGFNDFGEKTFSTVSGKKYVVRGKIKRGTSSSVRIQLQQAFGSFSVVTFKDSTSATLEDFTFYFTATGANYYLRLVEGGGGGTVYTKDITVDLADADRSVNNKGLIINGTVTRTAVATGADLVAYSGFSASNYLEQPYNSDLDFGTGDFCVMGWFKAGSFISNQTLISKHDGAAATLFQLNTFSGVLNFYSSGWKSSGYTPSVGVWEHITVTRVSGTLYIYAGGVLKYSAASTDNYTLSNATLRFGVNHLATWPLLSGGSLALWRISATAPTADQIAKIYETERDFFQEDASYTVPTVSDYTLDTPQKLWQLDDGSLSNRLTLERDATAQLQFIQTSDGATNAYFDIGAYANSTSAKVALSFSETETKASLNGGSVTSDTSTILPRVDTLRIGAGDGILLTSSYIKSIRYYPRRLTNTQLQELAS